MKIPKYIDEALKRRTKAADAWFYNDLVISEFIDKYNLKVDCADYHNGVEGIINPYESELRIRDIIKNS